MRQPIKYWALEFTDGRACVHTDWERASSADNAAKRKQREYGGIVYWVEGPFDSAAEAEQFLRDNP